MSVNPRLPDYETWCEQVCPFCNEKKPVVARGYAFVGQDGYVVPDRGYSFCNCKNVWYTDWSNIDQGTYFVKAYKDDHQSPAYDEVIKYLFNYYIKDIEANGNGGKRVLDLGSIVPYLLDEAKRHGYDTTGWDIMEHNDGHKTIVGNFDEMETTEKFDIIYTNHFFEHIRYPIRGLKKCYDMLNQDGIMFLSMPDPFQITWDNPARWGNFILRQHYIMWDMDSFCEEAENVGFKTILKKRNFDVRPLRDMHLIFKKDKWKPIS